MATRPKSTDHLRRSPSFAETDRIRAINALGNLSSINPTQQGHAIPLSTNYLSSSVQNLSNNLTVPPPLPPRTDTSRSIDRYNRYPTYNNFCSPLHSRYTPGMYSPAYGNFRTPYNRYGPHDSNSFIQLAEESTRPAFESIESVVDIVSSISMMLESTYHAVYSSYSAIIGVVDQFSRLKDHLNDVLKSLYFLRGLRYFCLKILYLLRLRKNSPSVEAAWNTAKSTVRNSDFSDFHEGHTSPWPFLLFISLVFGAPYLMFKLLYRSLKKNHYDTSTWKNSKGTYTACIAAYDFHTNRRGELSFKAGDVLFIAPKNLQLKVPKGWILACSRRKQVGLIPHNYLKHSSPAATSAKPHASSSGVQDIQSIPEGADRSNPVTSCNNVPDPFEEETESDNEQK